MDLLIRILHSPYLYIVLELAVIAVLLFFVRRWSKERKEWKQGQEQAQEKAKDDQLLQALANQRRRDRR